MSALLRFAWLQRVISILSLNVFQIEILQKFCEKRVLRLTHDGRPSWELEAAQEACSTLVLRRSPAGWAGNV